MARSMAASRCVIGIVAFFHSLYFVHTATLWLLSTETTKPGGW
jgi:hypothetical protein